MSGKNRRILCVDDEPKVLTAIERTLAFQYEVSVAHGAEAALKLMEQQEQPFAVVISDMRMPKINGAAFLTEVRRRAPKTVRMLLTGDADMDAAIAAVNHGQVFRFLTKPYPREALLEVVQKGVEQYHLNVAEADLLENTLRGTVDTLTEVLSLLHPELFSRASRLRSYVAHIARELEVPEAWEFEVAAMLSQIGCVAMPAELIRKTRRQVPLSTEEQVLFNTHPQVAHDLLIKIPRLETAAIVIQKQLQPVSTTPQPDLWVQEGRVKAGVRMLQVAAEFDRRVHAGELVSEVVANLSYTESEFDRACTEAVLTFESVRVEFEQRKVRIDELQTFMILNEDIVTDQNVLLLARGQEVTATMIGCLRNHAQRHSVNEPLEVLVPRFAKEEIPQEEGVA